MFERLAFAALLLAVASIPLLYDRAARDAYTTPKRAGFQVALWGIAAVVLLARSRTGAVQNRGILLSFLAVLVAVVSAARAESWPLALDRVEDLVLLWVPALLIGAWLLRTPRRVSWFVHALAVAGVLVAIVGILQHQLLDWWGYRPTLSAARSGVPPPRPDLLSIPGVAAALAPVYETLHALARPDVAFPWAGPLEPMLRDVFQARPFARLPTHDGPASVFGHPNVAAEVVAAGCMGLGVLAFTAFSRARADGASLRAVAGLLVRGAMIAIMGFYLVVTGTRGGWVAIAASSALVATLAIVAARPGRRARLALAACAVAVLLAAAAWLVASRVTLGSRGGGAPERPIDRVLALFRARDPARDTLLERRVLWANTGAMIDETSRADPAARAFGVGPGNWQVAYPRFHNRVMEHQPGTYTLRRYPDHAHQDPLEILAEGGLLTTALLGTLAALVLSRLLRRLWGAGAAPASAMAILAVLSTLFVMSAFSFPFHMPCPIVVAGLSFGAALSTGDPRDPSFGLSSWTARGAPWFLRAPIAALVTGGVVALGCEPAWAAAAAAAAGAVALLPLDRPWILGPPTARGWAVGACALAALSAVNAWSRVRGSEALQVGLDAAWGARFVPVERAATQARARAAFDRATLLDPANFLAEIARADAFASTGFQEDAIASARRGLVVHPWLINARVKLAEVHLARGEDDAAIREARAARALNADAPEPHGILGELMFRQGRTDLAVASFERAIACAPGRFHPRAKIRAAECLFLSRQDLPAVLRHLGEAEAEAESDPDLLARIAGIYSAAGAPPEFLAKGRAMWERVAALRPHDPAAKLRVTVAPLLAGEPDPAELASILEALDHLIAAQPQFEPARVRYFRGLTLERSGRHDEALRAYREAALLSGAPGVRGRGSDENLDAAIEAMRALQDAGTASRPEVPR